MAAPRPRLRIPQPPADRYITYYGDTQYQDFCGPLGIPPLPYWEWDAKTRTEGPYWWRRELQLEHVRVFGDPDEYRERVRDAHPDEADGERRLFYYVQQVVVRSGMDANAVQEWVMHELGGEYDTPWCRDVVAHALAGVEL
jgi:hypothetical protein